MSFEFDDMTGYDDFVGSMGDDISMDEDSMYDPSGVTLPVDEELNFEDY